MSDKKRDATGAEGIVMPGVRRWLLESFYRIAASGCIPRRFFAVDVPCPKGTPPKERPLQLEIVSHCWNYSGLLTYQLSSLVLYPPQDVSVKMTVFHSLEDDQTCRVLDFFAARKIPKVVWNWWPLPEPQLLRRAIGRNEAALATRADWIWFTDCDLVFHRGCLDALADICAGLQAPLVYPRRLRGTKPLQSDDPLFQSLGAELAVLDIDVSRFEPVSYTRAIGPLQIVRGDVARMAGYCRNINFYMEPVSRDWHRTFEDRTFRWLLGTRGQPMDLPGLYRIHHAQKGRRRGFFAETRPPGSKT